METDEFGEHKSIFSLTHTNEFVGTCKSALEPTPACCGVNQCRRVYEREGKKKPPNLSGGAVGLVSAPRSWVEGLLSEALYFRRERSFIASLIATGPYQWMGLRLVPAGCPSFGRVASNIVWKPVGNKPRGDKTPNKPAPSLRGLYGSWRRRACLLSCAIPFAWSPKQPRSRMLCQELGHGGFIIGINPHERGRPGGPRQWDARFVLAALGLSVLSDGLCGWLADGYT